MLAVLLVLPMLALGLLLARPELDVAWEHQPSHFWLVLITAGVNVALAYVTNEAATRRADARLVLVSLAFMASAGFLGLHALATPGVLLPEPNAGFMLASPVGLAVASVFAALSVSRLAGPGGKGVLRHQVALRRGLVLVMVAWAAVSLARLPPLTGPLPPQEATGPLVGMAVIGVLLFTYAGWGYAQIYRRRGSRMALAVAVAWVLLAQSMIAVALSRNWHLSWWEWHILMTIAFGLIAYGARAEYRRTGSLSAAFGGIYLEATLARLDRWHGRAIAEIAEAQAQGRSPDRLFAQLRREGASADELKLLEEAAAQMRRVDDLFRPYLPAQLAERLRGAPEMAELGGVERDVSVMFADLAGFTDFSEQQPPTTVVQMLNAHWAAVVPIIEEAGGLIEHFAGDGVMAIFNAMADQPDHAARAATAALAIIEQTAPLAEANRGWPRFRIGVNSGPAVVGNVGAAGRRTFGAIGDTSNLGARLMAAGQPGQVVISETTHDALMQQPEAVQAAPLGEVRVKGKREPVKAWVLEAAGSSL
jgi:adenylate cyclase